MKTFDDFREDLDAFFNSIGHDYMHFQNESKEDRDKILEDLADRFEPIFLEMQDKYQSLMDKHSSLYRKHQETLGTTIGQLQEMYFEHEKS